ncbi:PKD domain-containing protein [Actinokineospora inagensis]|uniref:PKD domain-containing protein n=1 Tax=Actinokineospora inagensis TaxID=103730 RepID=UPI00041CC4E5|nr:PKD domain-containing protein [Actinokineospora inagensis]
MDSSDRRRYFLRGLLMALLWLGFALWGAADAATSFTVTVQPFATQQYFTPNGDGQDDVVTVPYCLSDSAHVDVTVADQTGHVVRTLETAASRPADPSCQYNTTLSWDGKSDAGTVVPDGTYMVTIHAVSATGDTADAAAQAAVESRLPGALTAPAPNDRVSGTLSWRFTATPGINVTYASIACGTVQLGGSGKYPGGIFEATTDTAACLPGPNTLKITAFWTDPFGATHTWTSPLTPIVVDNPPALTIASWVHRYVSPNGDAQEDTADIYYCLNKDAKVSATVTNAAGATVRAIAAVDAVGSRPCYDFNNSLTWDGLGDTGSAVPNGVYTVRLVATDSSGQTAAASTDIGIDTRTPGVLTSPVAGATLSGDITWSFRPTTNFPVSGGDLYCDGTYMGSLDPVSFIGTGSVRACYSGPATVDAVVTWSDPFGVQHTWTSPPVSVTILNPPVVDISAYAHRYFSPDGDGQNDVLGIDYCLSQDSSVGVTIANASGIVVRTIPAVNQSGHAGCDGGNASVNWDGKDDAGHVQPDGVYTLRVRATDHTGQVGESTVQVGIDNRLPGALTQPAAGSTVSGHVDWRFQPTQGFTVNSLSLLCGTFELAYTDQLSGNVDTTPCDPGANAFTAGVSWTDAFGTDQFWETRVPLTVDNTPHISLRTGSNYFSPNGDGQEDTILVGYCVDLKATGTATVVDQAGSTVRTLTPVDATQCTRNHPLNYATWDGKNDAGVVAADGVYTLHIKVTGATGRFTEDSVQVGVDRRTPGALIAPKAGDTLAGRATIVFQPTQDFPLTQVDATFDTGGGASIYGPSPDGQWRTTVNAGALTAGAANLRTSVLSTDPFGNVHRWFAPEIPVSIDSTALPLTVSADPLTGPAPLATTLRVDTSEPRGQVVHYTANYGDGATASGDIASPYSTTELRHTYNAPGVFHTVVTVTNSTGATTTKSVDIVVSGRANTAPTATYALDTTRGVAPLPVSATVTATDAQDDALTYSLDFGDGTAAASGSLPHGPIGHTYTRAGTFLTRLVVSDGRLSTTKTASVVVGLPEPLLANAGDDQVGIEGKSVTFDGSGSRPSTGIDSYHWDFGDGQAADGAVAKHIYDTRGDYTATLTVTANGETKQGKVTVTVKPEPTASGLFVQVVNPAGTVVGGASLTVVDSNGHSYPTTADPSGLGHLQGIPDGSVTVYGTAPEYLPNEVKATIIDGAGQARLVLAPGEVVTSELDTKPMTRDEVVQAGIDPDAPENRDAYQFSVNIAVDPGPEITVVGYTAVGGLPACPQVNGTTVGCARGGATFRTEDQEVTLSVTYVNEKPQLVWLVMPLKASWLKEFFAVRMTVTNMAGEPFQVDHGTATLTLPAGLTLAPMATPQTPSIAMPVIGAGKSETASWVVRGDTEGSYQLSASYVGSLEPIGSTVSVQATNARPLHVWGASALTMTIDTDSTTSERVPFDVGVTLHNVADVPVYNLAIEAQQDQTPGFIYQPRERFEQTTDVIQPGESFTARYVLIPAKDGDLDLSRTFVSKAAGGRGFATNFVKHLRSERGGLDVDTDTPGVTKLRWSPLPGATEYQVFATSTVSTPFSDTPLLVTQGTSAVLPGGSGYYAISATIDGKPIMRHSLEGDDGSVGHAPKLRVTYDDGSSVDSVVDVSRGPRKLLVRATDQDGRAPALDWAAQAGQPTNSVHCVPVTVAVDTAGLDCVLDQGHYKVDLTFTTTDGTFAPVTRTVLVGGEYVALGDSYSSGEGAVPGGADLLDPRPHRPWFTDRDGTDTDNDPANMCHRSQYAYPNLLAGDATNFVFRACSGAKTDNVLNALSGHGAESKAQVSYLDKHTSLVTLSIGGNNVNFSEIISYCVQNSYQQIIGIANPCERRYSGSLANDIQGLSDDLKKVYTSVLAAAPNAQVYVMGYPRFFNPAATAKCPFYGVTPVDQTWINSAITQLNTTVQRAVTATPGQDRARITYVPVYDAFADHEACRPGPRLNDVVPTNLEYSFHPNRDGQSALAGRMRAAITGAAPRSILPNQTLSSTVDVSTANATLSVASAWPGSDIVTSLVSPSGRVIDRSTVADDVVHEVGPTGESYLVASAERGMWTINSYGAQVAEGGEPLTLIPTVIPAPTTPPVVTASSNTVSAVAGAPVTFTSAVGPQVWDFGDGATSSATNPVHAYTSVGTFTPTLAVATNTGDRAVVTLPPITVTAPPTPIASDQTVTTTGAPVRIHLTGVIAAGSLTYQIVGQPSHGTLTGGADLMYRPAPDYTGEDAFTFTATANGHTSPLGTVRLLVTPSTGATLPTTTTLSTTDATYGQPVVLAASVNATGGTFTYRVDGAEVCTVPVDGPACKPGLVPGTHAVTVSYSGANGFAPSEAAGSVTVTKLQTTVSYTGPSTAPSGSVTLTATVGSYPEKSTVEFLLYNSANTDMTTPDLRCVSPVGKPTCALTLPADSWTVIATIPANNPYLTAPAAAPAVLTTYPPVTDRAALGAGWVNGHGDFAFFATSKAVQSLYTYRGADRNQYIIKSTGRPDSVTFTTTGVTFTTKCAAIVLAPNGTPIPRLTTRNLACRVSATDAKTDTYAITVTTAAGSVYHQAGTPTAQLPLQGGAILLLPAKK